MDPAFHDIYREQVELYRVAQVWPYYIEPRIQLLPLPLRGQSFRLLAVVTEAIESGIAALGGKYELRPDARLFLTVNLHQMVMLPLAHPDSPRELNTEVEQGLKADARMILESAADHTRDRNDITAGHVLRATSEILDRLTLKSWRLWD
jgi:hypothetical protein